MTSNKKRKALEQRAMNFLISLNVSDNKQFFDMITTADTKWNGKAREYIKRWVEYDAVFDDYSATMKRSLELGTGFSEEKIICMYGEKYGPLKIKERLKKCNTSSLESKIRRYGKEKGTELYNKMVKRQAYTNSKEYHGMTDEEFKLYNSSRAVTLDNMIKRYGKEKGTDKFNNYCERQAYTNSKEYYIEKYGPDGDRLWEENNKLKSQSLDNFIRKYGPDGEKKYKEYIQKRPDFASKMANDFFDIIDKSVDYKSYYDRKSKEFCVWNAELKSPTFFDYVIPELGICIEFNGDVFHGNPSKYSAKDCPNPYDKSITAEEIWENDRIKQQGIKDRGYDVYIVWESEYLADKDKEIKRISSIIKNSKRKEAFEESYLFE